MRVYNPEPHPGLRRNHFRKVCENGFGDRYNGYAYSMAWFNNHLYVGTSRANLCLLKFAMPFVTMDHWPVECPHLNYTPEFEHKCARGEIWRFNPLLDQWNRVYQSPFMTDDEGVEFSRDLGYRGMTVFQGKSNSAPALYVSTWSRSRGSGPDILCSEDGQTFITTPKPRFTTQGREITVTAIRVLVSFKGKLYTAPVGAAKGNVNASGLSLVYESDDPATGNWRCVNEPGFGELPDVMTIYEMAVLGEYLYVGTAGLSGFQIWRTDAEGVPPYHWEQVITNGAERGGLNQGSASMISFKGALYIGTGIQNGGYDHRNKIGPAASEIIRLHPDGSWDIIVGSARNGKKPLSGLGPGFNNYFCGYLWRMGIHQGWLYAGTMDWSLILRYVKLEEKPVKVARMIAALGVEEFIKNNGGASLWRTYDGENWLPVTLNGFKNPYNYGIRNIVSTPHGLFIGTANPFGPRAAIKTSKKEWEWSYVDNPDGGLEVWQGIS
ncbi:hypothetical protein [Anabaena sp. PCC 7108]|uniref:hypothetical protein n=1 Tax=Anabaena sp. PCC 7108 TaxID=163908 RepID=UPI0003454D0F|nr:hypothetical protein [Anabaena sp. PCC 7108]